MNSMKTDGLIGAGSVKICSLRETVHAQYVVDAGADLFGLIFVPGVRRFVTAERAREIVERVRLLGGANAPSAVGVFVDQPAMEINGIADEVGLDFVQLSGSETPEFVARIERPVVKALRPGPDESLADVLRLVESYGSASVPPAAFLIDAYHATAHGGTGIRANWSIAAEVARDWPVMLAGGLTSESVGEAIRSVRPLAVDVASGVETDGAKNQAKILRFVAETRTAFARLGFDGRSK